MSDAFKINLPTLFPIFFHVMCTFLKLNSTIEWKYEFKGYPAEYLRQKEIKF